MHEAAYSFTTKISGDLLTIRGRNIEEFERNLKDIDKSTGDLIVRLQNAARQVS